MATREQQLAYEAVVELLAHQFAYPVKWIDTQNILFDEMAIKKVVEIGPSNTLTVMSKRTIGSKFKEHDEAHQINRDLLACEENTRAVYFETDDVAKPQSASKNVTKVGLGNDQSSSENTPPNTVKRESKPKEKTIYPKDSRRRNKVKTLVDVEIKARDILIAIMSLRLKKSPAEISDDDTIKALAKGRSTLENEIVGDLVAEFGAIPDAVEEKNVGDLSTALESRFSGVLGRPSSSMLEKLLANKMPMGFQTKSVVEMFLSGQGFGPGMQTKILLEAAAVAPSTRFSDAPAAQNFLTDIAAKYSPVKSSIGEVESEYDDDDDDSPVDNTTAAASHTAENLLLSDSHKQLTRRQLSLYADSLGIDLNHGQQSVEHVQNALRTAQEALKTITDELGEEFADGIKPMFDVSKVRVFDSSWAWEVQDITTLFHNLVSPSTTGDERELERIRHRLANHLEPQSKTVLEYYISLCNHETRESYRAAGEALKNILRCSENRDQPVFCARSDPSPIISPLTSMNRKKNGVSGWFRDPATSESFCGAYKAVHQCGISFSGYRALVTGAGAGSIGWRILAGMLEGGAQVIVTTASFSSSRMAEFQDLYVRHGAKGSKLIVIPFNQGSQSDIASLVDYIYDKKHLGWVLDAMIPFAATSDVGEIDQIDSRSELAHRIMLTNTVRLIGRVKEHHKEISGIAPVKVLLPLSANHGLFGADGLYAESKLALESLFDKWYSEGWADVLSICGVGIGWTRGTGLMKENDRLAREVEMCFKVHTFTQGEMGACILALLDPRISDHLEDGPLYADFHGGLDNVEDFSTRFRALREKIKEKEDFEAAIRSENTHEELEGTADCEASVPILNPRANLEIGFPTIPDYQTDIAPLSALCGIVDLDSAIVVTGLAEIGPWGNSRTRWQRESTGTFSIEGWVEMAWMMGLIKYVPSPSIWKGREIAAGWSDTSTGEPIQDWEVESRYGEYIFDHCGIRNVEPDLWEGYDPDNKVTYQEVVIEADLEPFEVSEEIGQAFIKRHGSLCQVVNGKAHIKRGATLLIPKASRFGNNVAGQVPTGFDPRRYGISEEVIMQVDPITLFSLICTVEALFSSGIVDPYEIYKHIHTSEAGNCVGTGLGGIRSSARMFCGRPHEQAAASDVLQETFLNTTAAWINMLLLSSNGPIRTPVGACATALESLDTAYDLITTGKAKFCLVGAVDDLEEHVAFEFGNMKATLANDKDLAAGRLPSEMCRPTASDRRGFLESQGCGIQVVCTARLALDMGLPIYGVLAFTGTSSDKANRSVPAPGQGVVVNARETSSGGVDILSLEYRREQLTTRQEHIRLYEERRSANIEAELDAAGVDGNERREKRDEKVQMLKLESQRLETEALRSIGSQYLWRRNPSIAPIRGALATWGLTIDDIQVASFHGTSTVKNELNECSIMQKQFNHLGRAKGNRVLGVFQKHLTGHPKGAAGAWMLNGCLQILDSGLVPGNANADNIDLALKEFDHIAFLNRSVQTVGGLRACTLFSFGFGQKGAQAIVVHPRYLFAAIPEEEFTLYQGKALRRQRVANAEFNKRLVEGSIFQAKEKGPYEGEEEARALVDPSVRL